MTGRRRARTSPVDGIWRVHKSPGETSFSRFRATIASLEAEVGCRLRACHGGTLDPFAHGLLLVLVGDWVHAFDAIHTLPKTYVADLRWGVETDNGDPTGQVVATADAPRGDRDAALASFLGWQEQVPPATSAKKVEGEPAYRKAHRGELVSLAPSRVYLHSARWLIHHDAFSRLELVCRGGYYVRSLARDLGRLLDSRAHLSALSRPRIGPFVDVAGAPARGGEPSWTPPPGFPSVAELSPTPTGRPYGQAGR